MGDKLNIRPCSNETLIAVTSGLCWMIVFNIVRSTSSYILSSKLSEPESNTTEFMLAVAIVLGILFAAITAENFGRKPTILIGVTIYLAGSILLLISSSPLPVLVSLFGLGFLLIGPVYYWSDCFHPKKIGKLCSFSLAVSSCGMVSYFDSKMYDVSCTVLLSTITFVLGIYLPESPVFLVEKGMEKDALQTLTSLRSSDLEATREFQNMTENQKEMKLQNSRYLGGNSSIFVALLLIVTQQFSGIVGLSQNALGILEQGEMSVDPRNWQLAVFAFTFASFVVAGYVHTHIDRKVVFGISSMFIINIYIFIVFYFTTLKGSDELKSFAQAGRFTLAILIVMFYIAFVIGPGSISILYLAESFSNNYRMVVVILGVTLNILLVFISNYLFTTCLNAMGVALTFLTLSVLTSILSFTCYSLMVETRGKSSIKNIKSHSKHLKNN